MNKYDICTQEDEYSRSFAEGEARWVVHLNDGTVVYQDDRRPNHISSAWIRLYWHCKIHKLYIVKYYIQFRSNSLEFPQNRTCYWFSHLARGVWGDAKTRLFFLCGYIQEGQMLVEKISTPELLKESSSYRQINKLEYVVCHPNAQKNLCSNQSPTEIL